MEIASAFIHLSESLLHHWGYWIVLGASFVETIPILGGFIPGQTAVIASGFLVRVGVLDAGDVIALAALGAILGDCLSYYLGRRYGYDFIYRYGRHVFFKPEVFEKTRETLQAHAGKTLILGRFIPLTRALAPFVAGASNISFQRFLIYNVIGGLAWAVVSVSIGYLFGASYELAAAYFGRLVLAVVTLFAFMWLGIGWYRRLRRLPAAYPLTATIANTISIIIFGWLAHLAVASWRVRAFDWSTFLWIEKHRLTLLTEVMIGVSRLIDPPLFILWSILISVWLIFRKRWLDLGVALVTIGGGLMVGAGVKWLIHRPRPSPGLIIQTDFSFPSLHSTAVVLLSLVLIYSLRLYDRERLQHSIWCVLIIFSLLVGFSRVYLGVHWVSDVLAGYALAIFWFSFVIIVARLFRPHPDIPRT